MKLSFSVIQVCFFMLTDLVGLCVIRVHSVDCTLATCLSLAGILSKFQPVFIIWLSHHSGFRTPEVISELQGALAHCDV